MALAPTRHIPVHTFLDLAELTESLGYHSVWVQETWGDDAVSLLAAAAMRTTRIRLASGVWNVYSRSPALIAQTAATLQNLSSGRFVLGLGASGPRVIEGWHGVPFRQPLVRTRETVHLIRLALEGEPVEGTIDGRPVAGFRLSNPPQNPPPIYLAALGPRNVRLAGQIADGWLPIFLARGQLGALRAPLTEGTLAAGRDPQSIAIAAFLPYATGQRGETLLRQQLAYYIGGMGTFYHAHVATAGFAQTADAIRDAWASGHRRTAVEEVTPELLAACTLGSNAPQAMERLGSYRTEGLNLPIVAIPHGATPEEASATLRELAP